MNKEKFWLKSYPSNIPTEIEIASSSIDEEFEKSIEPFHHQTAFENFGQKISFAQWKNLSLSFASYLQNHCHLQKGDKIAVQIPNLLQTPIVIMGALKAGLTLVNLNPLYTSRETKEILQDAKPKAMIVFSASASRLEEILDDCPIPHIIVTEIGDLFPPLKRWLFYIVTHFVKKIIPAYRLSSAVRFNKALALGKKADFKKIALEKNDIAFLQYTGGTTGSPKGAILSHGNILSNLLQCKAWMSPYLNYGKEISITALPLYHIFALTVNLLLLPFYGSHSILITNPRDTKNFIRLLKKTKKFTVFVGVNSLFKLLLNQKDFHDLDFFTLKCCIAGGASVEKSVFDNWLKATKTPLIEGYGLTEASPVVSCNILDQPVSGSCGLPFPSTLVRIMDQKGRALSPGQAGELEVKGPQVMQGYWNKPDETKKVLDENGWLKTGDIAQINPNGWIHILDRKKDMILVSGFNVYPNEIESILSLHQKIKNSAVIGVPDSESGEAPKAFIVKQDSSLTKEEVQLYLKQNLTGYKIPKHIEFREELPHSHVGKVLRRKLQSPS